MNSFDFKFGTEVYCRDKQWGHLAKVAVGPDGWCVTEAIVESGLLFKRKAVVPVSQVEVATTTMIRLADECDELTGYPQFSETTVERDIHSWQMPVETNVREDAMIGMATVGMLPTVSGMTTVRENVRQGVADDKIVLGNEVAVYGLDGHIGYLSHLIADVVDGQIQYLVITKGTFFPKYFVVPVEFVQTLGEQGIQILATDTEFNEFPELSALPIEDTDSERSAEPELPEMDKETGPFKNDTRMATAVRTALMSELGMETAVIEVISMQGIVTLTGKVSDRTIREAAGTIASQQSGVIKVINDLKVGPS
jgi:uncharacterized protein YrrD